MKSQFPSQDLNKLLKSFGESNKSMSGVGHLDAGRRLGAFRGTLIVAVASSHNGTTWRYGHSSDRKPWFESLAVGRLDGLILGIGVRKGRGDDLEALRRVFPKAKIYL